MVHACWCTVRASLPSHFASIRALFSLLSGTPELPIALLHAARHAFAVVNAHRQQLCSLPSSLPSFLCWLCVFLTAAITATSLFVHRLAEHRRAAGGAHDCRSREQHPRTHCTAGSRGTGGFLQVCSRSSNLVAGLNPCFAIVLLCSWLCISTWKCMRGQPCQEFNRCFTKKVLLCWCSCCPESAFTPCLAGPTCVFTAVQATRPQLTRWLDSVGTVWSKAVIGATLLTAAVLPFMGVPFLGDRGALYRAMGVLTAGAWQ